MAKARFGGSCERDDTIDRFENKMKKIMWTAAKAALKAEGIKFKVEGDEILITKQYLPDEKWVSYFDISSYANSI